MITIREYVRPAALEEAWALNQKRTSRVIGGMLWLKMQNAAVGTAIDLSGLGLDTVGETPEGFAVGAMTSLRALETHAGLNEYTNGAVREALRHIVGVQFRNTATLGGSVYGRFGFSDVLTLLLALNASVELYKGGIVPLARFAGMPYDRDILVRVHIPKENAAFFYQSVRPTKTDFPSLTCAAARLADGAYRFAVGARPGKAVVLMPQGAPDALPEIVSAQIETGSNLRGSAEYRKHLIRVLVRRAVDELEGSAKLISPLRSITKPCPRISHRTRCCSTLCGVSAAKASSAGAAPETAVSAPCISTAHPFSPAPRSPRACRAGASRRSRGCKAKPQSSAHSSPTRARSSAASATAALL